MSKSKASLGNEISGYSGAVSFAVGTKNVEATVKTCDNKADLNNDCKVNLVDYSIAAYWWKRTLTPDAIIKVDNKLYPDGKLDLRDFSVMAYYWTG